MWNDPTTLLNIAIIGTDLIGYDLLIPYTLSAMRRALI
jgi:hypothetical protein